MTLDACATRRHFSAVITHLSLPALLLGPQGEIWLTNPLFDRQTSQDSKPASGRPFTDLLTQPHKAPFTRFLTRCQRGDAVPDDRLHCSIDDNGTTMDLCVCGLWVDGAFSGLLCQADATPQHDDLKLKYLMDHLDQGVWDYNTRSNTFIVSQAWRRMRGLSPDDDVNNFGADWLDQIHPDDREALKNVFGRQTRGTSDTVNIQYRRRHADGHWFWVLCSSKVMARDDTGLPTRIVGTDSDITALRQSEADITQLVETLRLAIDASEIGIWEFDPNTGTVFWDDTMLQMYGLTDGKNKRSGELWETYLHPDDLADTLAYSDHCQKNGLDFRRDYRVIHADGGVRHVRSRASQVDVPGKLPKLIGVNIDVTEDYGRAKELEDAKAQLLHDSRHDALTGLANRRMLDETAATFFENLRPDQTYAALHLDLDHFKKVNDTLGHAAGDAVLASVAATLGRIIADTGLVARIGGDEFAVFFETAPTQQSLETTCTAIIEDVQKPIAFANTTCAIGVSIGCAVQTGPTRTQGKVFSNADAALYAAKSAGRNCFRVHNTKEVAA
ncbi:diguanylate cyclase [Octadecabacter sp. G9-8]|uniref:Diguanylate cyclase n=1 Tax=Octadecabacter dasysiphoniae TaxID=2909341 RepID=A0ABS9CUZ0_9RHOB|nr:diguanylate cyclase [Octadecabacter dasysiphoniae]MCF2869838.1 diguanylate cyclase [Octadecabacter dasysiphoniae]